MSDYQSSPIKRRRRTRAELGELKGQMLEIVAENRPMTCRQLFYQMVSRGLIEKEESEYQNTVIRLATVLRRAGEMPFRWLTDNTRMMRKPLSHQSLSTFLEDTQSFYRRDLWQDQSDYVEVWLEKDALSGVLFEATRIWDVPLMVSRGYSSMSFLHAAAETITHVGKPTYLYYFGDADPSGRDIPRVIERTLRELAPTADIKFQLVAVTDEQIAHYRLPTRPTKKTDVRARGFVGESVEVDALPPRELVRLCRECIEQHIDPEILDRHRTIERAEKATLQQVVQNLAELN